MKSTIMRAGLAVASLGLVLLVLSCAAIVPGAAAAGNRPFVGSFGPDGTGATSFEHPAAVATDQSNGDVYVADLDARAIYKFGPEGEPREFSGLASNELAGIGFEPAEPTISEIAVDESTHDFYVTDYGAGAIMAFAENGEPAEFTAGPGAGSNELPAPTELCGVAVDPQGDIYMGDYGTGVHVYAPDGEEVDSFEAEEACNVAVSATGAVYVAHYDGPVERFEPSQYPVTASTTWTSEGVVYPGVSLGLSVDPSTDDLLVVGNTPTASEAVSVREYDPSGTQVGRFGESGAGQIGGSEGVAVGAAGKVYVSETVGGKAYIFGPPEPEAPTVESEWTVSAGEEVATVAARIAPGNAATTYRVEYGSDGSYGEQTPEATLGGSTATATLEGLSPGTTYHYRFVATNAVGADPGEDRELTTQRTLVPDTSCPNQAYRTGAAAALPDCRAYEMVSHAVRENADVLGVHEIDSNLATLDQAAAEGGALAWSSYHAAEGSASAPYDSQYIARRGTDGWEDESISPPRGTVIGPIPFFDDEYMAFSADLCEGWLLYPPGTHSLAAGAIEGYANLYRRSDCGDAGYEALSVPEAGMVPEAPIEEFRPDLEGVAEEGDLAVFQVEDRLTAEAAGGRALQVYGYSDGTLRDICVLPDGAALSGSCAVGTENKAQVVRHQSVGNAVSADGTRVYWSGVEGKVLQGGGSIYLRVNPGKEQSAVQGEECTQPELACTLPVSGLVSGAAARFFGASRDGSRALFGISEGSGTAVGRFALYLYDAESRKATHVAGEVNGVLGYAQDMGRVYLASEEKLAEGGTEGQPDVYLYEPGDGGFRFVAALSTADVDQSTNGGSKLTPTAYEPFLHAAQASPDGGRLAFISTATPTGYDNTDEESGEADAEVYLYDAEADGGKGSLVCASCNPTGVRPTGGLVEIEGKKKQRVAAWIAPAETQLYTPRDLADGGRRLFFMSFETLVPGDTNGAQDVYEWEAPGTGTCTTQASEYSAANGGCLSLISSGKAPGGASFLDASESGDDAFFTTGQSLVGADKGLIDIYDARVEGGLPEEAAPAECEGQACQAPPAPAGTASPGEGSSTVARAEGNLAVKRRCARGSRTVRRHGAVRCVRKKARRHHHKKRHGRAAKENDKKKGTGR